MLPSAALAFAAGPRAVALVLLVLAAAACDWRTRRVPNLLNLAGALAGLALAGGGAGPGPSAAGAVAGAATGLALLLPLYALRISGAGDVKLMAAVGAFLGPVDVAFAVVFTFVAGGALALVWVVCRSTLPRLVANLRAVLLMALAGGSPAVAIASVGRMPYALAVCAGTFACLWLRHPFMP